jgi:hypothetical protein
MTATHTALDGGHVPDPAPGATPATQHFAVHSYTSRSGPVRRS